MYKKSEWTEEEKQFLIDNKDLPVKEQSEALSRTTDAIYKMRHALNISDQKIEKRVKIFKNGPIKVAVTDDKEIVIAIQEDVMDKVIIKYGD